MATQIFVIHGRDPGAKDTVARFLQQIELKPVVLQELPSRGRTVIEKFQEHAERTTFAVALFTPDDIGGLQSNSGNLQARTRQNVICELGYFIGKFGRDRVRVLFKDEVEIPTDYAGVVYIPWGDDDAWKGELIRELKDAGYDVDANNVF